MSERPRPEPAETGEPAPAPGTPARGTPASGGWRRLAGALRPRSVRGTALATALTLLLGVAVSTQLAVTRDQGLADLRPEELVAILGDVNRRADRLDRQAEALAAERRRLQDEDEGGAAAVIAARERVDTLRILVGSVPVEGPGIRLVVSDPHRLVEPAVVLDAIQELRDAGAEAIQVGAARVVASSYVRADSDGSLGVDGVPLSSPFTVLAVGDPATMATAMAIPGGVAETVRGVGATITVTRSQALRIDAVHQGSARQYARDVPTE